MQELPLPSAIAQMILQKNIGCRWYSLVFFLWQPTGHSTMPNGSLSLVTIGREDRRGPMITDVFLQYYLG